MPAIAAVIIARNEEKNIKRCIESLDGVVDEVVVVDSGSIDNTIQVAESLGARVIPYGWEGYAGNKNFGNSRVHAPYILSIDSDEALSPVLKQALIREKRQLTGAYRFNRLTNYCGHWIRHCGWYPDRKVRLFPKGMAEWQGEYVHETLVLQPGTPVRTLTGDLLHYSISSKEDHINRAQTYARLAARKMHASGKRYHPLKKYASSATKFVRMYILKLGFLDGGAGFQVCAISAKARAWRYNYLRDLQAGKLAPEPD